MPFGQLPTVNRKRSDPYLTEVLLSQTFCSGLGSIFRGQVMLGYGMKKRGSPAESGPLSKISHKLLDCYRAKFPGLSAANRPDVKRHSLRVCECAATYKIDAPCRPRIKSVRRSRRLINVYPHIVKGIAISSPFCRSCGVCQ